MSRQSICFLYKLLSTCSKCPTPFLMPSSTIKTQLNRGYSPPYNSTGDAFRDYFRELHRSIRKSVGLPASRDVGTLAELMKELIAQVEKYLGHEITTATVAVPHLTALYQEDVLDLFTYLHLKYIDVSPFSELLYETSAAYAGHGLGLCSNYRQAALCIGQMQNMTSERVLAVELTNSVLAVHEGKVSSAYYLEEGSSSSAFNHHLGLACLNTTLSEVVYWENVRNFIEHKITSDQKHLPKKVILYGESATNDYFNQLIKNILEDFSPSGKSPLVFNDHPEFILARGAAEFAKRSYYQHTKGKKTVSRQN